MDLKKLQFQADLKRIIAKNPNWATEAVKATTDGIDQAVEKFKDDNNEMAVLLLLFYLSHKYGREVSKETKLKTIEKLAVYFDMKIVDRTEAIDLYSNWRLVKTTHSFL
jgi:hypothetical protein